MLLNNQYLEFFKVNSLPAELQPNAMYLVKGKKEDELELHIADKNGQNTRSILSTQDVDIDNRIYNFIDFSKSENFNFHVKKIVNNTKIDVNNIINIDQRILEVLDGSEHTSRLEVKNTYQELKQLAEDKKLDRNQFVFVIDATSPEAKVDKGSATFLYQVPNDDSRKTIEENLLKLKTLLADKDKFDKELKELIADGYHNDDLKDILQAKQAISEYFVNLNHSDIKKLTMEKNAILDFKDLGLLISNFVKTWNIFQDTVPKELQTSKSSTVFKLKNLIKDLSDKYENFVARESAHKIIKVAEHESMDLKFEVKWGDIQDIPEPITKIITGHVLLQAVEW